MARKAGAVETVLELADGRTWVRLLDQRAADEEGRLAMHAVGHFFRVGVAHGLAFYSLRSPDGDPLVTAMLPADPERGLRVAGPRHMDDPQVVGPRNADPFPSQGDAIAALGGEIGMELGSELYTYRRSRADDPEDEVVEDEMPLMRP